jgi:hypothetical protein
MAFSMDSVKNVALAPELLCEALAGLPMPWVGPVIAPVLVSLSMIVAGVVLLWRESLGRPVCCGRLHWALFILGGLVVIAAFCWDCRHTAAGGWPNPFNWPLFTLGEAMAAAGFVHALGRRRDSL